jgi:hypothetical protein
MSILRIKTLDESLHQSFTGGSKRRRSSTNRASFSSCPDSCHSDISNDLSTSQSSSLAEDGLNDLPTQAGVQFDRITIRNYNMTLTDNPSCTRGIPVGLSWEYDPEEIEVPFEDYESSRDGFRRSKREMIIPDQIRYHTLRYEFDVSRQEITDMIKEVQNTRRQRLKAATQPQRRVKLESFLKTAKKGFSQIIRSNKKKCGIESSLHRHGSIMTKNNTLVNTAQTN